MIAIKIDFPASRWHATAWGTHVNEGVTEWPPCPWRLCRALIAAWHWKHRQDEPALRSLIEKLAAQPPAFRLPNASTAHTRHYMPVITGPKESKTKIFDTFVHITAGESLWIRWDADLTENETSLLSTLLESLSYLGRAESLVSASLADTLPVNGNWSVPAGGNQLREDEIVRLLTPQLPGPYAAWALAQSGPPKATKAKTKKKPDTTLPMSLFEALQLDTADWKKEGWNLPPGARWVDYTRSRDSLKVAPSGIPPTQRRTKAPTVARFALVSKVPPAITQSLSLAERFHQALCKHLEGHGNSPALTGLDDHKAPLTGNNHVYFLPECDAHGYVTHMTLHAPLGFDDTACRVFGRLRKVWGMEGFDVKVVLLATGQPENFADASPYFKKSKVWTSLTPYVPVRHPKATRTGIPKMDAKKKVQIGSPEHDCWRLLETVAPTLLVSRVTTLGTRIKHGLRDIPCLDFQRQRRTGNGTRAGNRGYALRIDFEEEVSLPFGFGYAAHFGLGLFVPVDA
ncbi:MAG: type I-U CRISPR-associated protein Csb2 [Opitutaceae bacterium]|nr:type I-U CRISPR-associated protein Csb2 [Opitutaceae bacterium]